MNLLDQIVKLKVVINQNDVFLVKFFYQWLTLMVKQFHIEKIFRKIYFFIFFFLISLNLNILFLRKYLNLHFLNNLMKQNFNFRIF